MKEGSSVQSNDGFSTRECWDLICLLKHFLWHLNREWIKMDAFEAGETVFF